MDFSKRKLPKEAAETLRKFSVDTVKPYTLMVSPVYVYLRKNQKFISVKGPLDFFTEKDIEKLLPYEIIFVPPFVDRVLPFAQAGRHVKVLLNWQPHKEDALPPAPFEISDSILRVIGPLWGMGLNGVPVVEPFFVAAFVNELCLPIPPEQMLKAREQDTLGFETAILRSSWAVFLALHLGFCDLEFLNQLRIRVFDETAGIVPAVKGRSDIDQLIQVCHETLRDSFVIRLDAGLMRSRKDRVSKKLCSRLERVRDELIDGRLAVPTIYGEGGFVDA